MLARLAEATAFFALVSTFATGALAAPPPGGPRGGAGRTETIRHVAETGSVAATEAMEEDGGTCTRARRRLWVEGEGWVVRRITTCR